MAARKKAVAKKQAAKPKKERDPAIDNVKTFDVIIVEPILSIGIAFVANNYTVFLKKTVGGEEVHTPIGYYGGTLESALRGMSKEILNKRVTRKAKDASIPLDELRDLILKHNLAFEKLFKDVKKK